MLITLQNLLDQAIKLKENGFEEIDLNNSQNCLATITASNLFGTKRTMYGYYDFYNRNNDVFITLPRIFGDFCELRCGRRDEGVCRY